MTVETLPTVGRRRLPSAAGPRFLPLRAGILNVWEYDNQEFWFAEGRLLLRGVNGSGKSKALELLVPFVLDGETHPSRLDPLGGTSKSMYWNMVGFRPERRSAPTGYGWLEFGRVGDDGPEYVTVLVGIHCRPSNRRPETWFGVTSLRVGADLDLAPGGQALNAARLSAAIAGHGKFRTTAREHRAAADQALFGLGPERYEALIHLLLRLRKPKLSERLELGGPKGGLSLLLRDALPPLTRSKIENLAEAFSRLDSDTADLAALEASHRDITEFLAVYRTHARLQVRLASGAVSQTVSNLDKITETVRKEQERAEAASEQLLSTEREQDDVAQDTERLRGNLDGLDLSKVHALSQVQAKAASATAAAAEADLRSDADLEQAERSGAAAVVVRRACAEAEAAFEETATAAAGLAETAGLAEYHAASAGRIIEDPAGTVTALDGAAVRRHVDLRRLAEAVAAAFQAQVDTATATAAVDRTVIAAEQARDDAAAAEVAAADAADEFASGVDEWVAAFPAALETPAAGEDGLTLGDTVLAEVRGASDPERAARTVAARLAGPAREAVAARRAVLTRQIRELDDEAAALRTERARTDQAAEAPAPTPGRPALRADGHVPLWRCVEFLPGLSPEEEAGIEAALLAAGILDAAITANGLLLDRMFDTVLSPVATSPSLLRWLVASPDSPIAPDTVTAALGSVGAGADTGSCWIATDGSWSNGPLSGRWQVDHAAYVGAEARAAARRRRIAAIDVRLDELADLAAAFAADLASAAALALGIEAAIGDFPTTAALREALRDEARLQGEAHRRAAEAAQAAIRADEARAEAVERATTRDLLAAELRCPADSTARALEAVAEYRRAVSGFAGRAATVTARRSAAADADGRAAEDKVRAEQSAAKAKDADLFATRAAGEAEELARTCAADVDDVLRRQRELQDELAVAGQRAKELVRERDAAVEQKAKGEAALGAAEAQRAEREQERASALDKLAALAQSELGPLALGPIDQDRDLSQVTAGRTFARYANERLADVAVDDRARSMATNALHSAYSDLKIRVGADYGLHLDTVSGVSVCSATFNGEPTGAVGLEKGIAEQVSLRRERLSAEERENIETYLVQEVGEELAERLHAARLLVDRMNVQLAARPTWAGVSVHLRWDVDPDISGAPAAVRLLRERVRQLPAADRASVATFLAERVRIAREDGDGEVVDRLASALDYRAWHQFSVYLRHRNGKEEKLTARSHATGSGGEQAKVAHLPLFAAASAYYASAYPTAPHLIVLDEAFVGIDDAQRADCYQALVDFQLDFVCTNFSEWGAYAEVPQLAIYHLERVEGIPGVAAIRWLWDGTTRREDDPFLEDTMAAQPSGSLFGDGS